MNDLLKQLSGLLGAGFTAACCLGLPLVLSAVGVVGLGFIINDAYLMPLFAAFVVFTLWGLFSSAKTHGDKRAFWLGSLSGFASILVLFLLVTGFYPSILLLSLTLAGLVAACIWSFILNKKAQIIGENTRDKAAKPHINTPDGSRRKVNGAMLAVASAGIFYGLYQSVNKLAPAAKAGDIKCWGGNSCKGQSACNSALNSCTGLNSCKGQGWGFMSERACYLNGGERFEGSEGDVS